eukprot:119718_1
MSRVIWFNVVWLFVIIQFNGSMSNNCTVTNPVICITGQTSYNDWFYVEYDYGGCYGDKPYYYNATNNQYIYWNYQYNRWHSYTTVGSNGDTAYAYPSTGENYQYNRWHSYTTVGSNGDTAYAYPSTGDESLHATSGQWSVNSPIISRN